MPVRRNIVYYIEPNGYLLSFQCIAIALKNSAKTTEQFNLALWNFYLLYVTISL